MIEINYWAVLAAGAAGMVVGAIWYGPLFGRLWMGLSGMNQEKISQMKGRGMAKAYTSAFIMVLVMAFVLAQFIQVFEAEDASGAFQLTFWIWLGFLVPLLLSPVIWQDKRLKLFVLDSAHYLIAVYVMALVLTLWK